MTMLLSSSLFLKTAPKNLAAFTKASSSGEEALYFLVLSSRIMVWQSAKCKTTFSISV